MLNRLILKVTKFQLPPPKRLGTVIENILGAIMPPPPPCQIGLNGQKYLRSVPEDLISNKQKRTKRICQERRRYGHYKTLRPYFSTGHNFV